MSWFGFIQKFILSKCYPPNTETKQIIIETKRSDIIENKEMPETVHTPVMSKRHKKNEQEVDELLREIEPVYIAPKKIDIINMTNREKDQKNNPRFDMEESDFGSWGGTEDFELE